MHEYSYKNFLIRYEIGFFDELNIYFAKGEAQYLEHIQRFATEGSSLQRVKEDIEKLIKYYIDFEYNQIDL